MGMGRVGDDPRAPWRRVAARMRAHATSSVRPATAWSGAVSRGSRERAGGEVRVHTERAGGLIAVKKTYNAAMSKKKSAACKK